MRLIVYRNFFITGVLGTLLIEKVMIISFYSDDADYFFYTV
jgi:hypothetical protein